MALGFVMDSIEGSNSAHVSEYILSDLNRGSIYCFQIPAVPGTETTEP